MFKYTYNLRDLGFQEDQYDSIASKAQRLARNASAVDTGSFKRGWVTSVIGDQLIEAPMIYESTLQTVF